MANLTFSLPVPAGDGNGAVVNISTSTRQKTAEVTGDFTGIIFIAGSCDGVNFNDVARFDQAGIQNIDDTIIFARVRRIYTAGGPLPMVCLSCPDTASIMGTVTANQGAPGAMPWPVTVTGAGLATEATLLNVLADTADIETSVANLDVPLSTRASEATLATRATEATLAAILVDTGDIETSVANIEAEGGATGAAVPARAKQVGGRDGAGLLKANAVDTNGFIYERSPGSLAQAVADGRIVGVTGDFSGTVITAAAAEAVVRQTAYVQQAANSQRSFSSSSALDTNAAGTGARTIRLTYYSFVAGVMTGPFTEIIALAGLVAVNTVAVNICFIEKIEVITRGAGATPPIGIVTMFALAGGAGGAIASIAAGQYSTRYGHHYIASGRSCFLNGGNYSSTAAAAQQPRFSVRAFDFSVANASETRVMNDISSQGSSSTVSALMPTPLVIPGPSVLVAYVTPSNAVAQSQFATHNFYEV